MTKPPRKNVPDVGIELGAACMPSELASDRATAPGILDLALSHTDKIVGIPMGTDCAPLVADLFLFCYERYFMMSLFADKDGGSFEAFSSRSRY